MATNAGSGFEIFFDNLQGAGGEYTIAMGRMMYYSSSGTWRSTEVGIQQQSVASTSHIRLVAASGLIWTRDVLIEGVRVL
jgi:hypothetical protein